MKKTLRLTCFAPLAVALLTMNNSRAQSTDAVPLVVTDADMAAQVDPNGLPFSARGVAGRPAPNSGLDPGRAHGANAAGSSFYPLDASNPDGGPVVVRAQHHNIYINQPPSHWGDPATFLTDLGNSSFIHLVDQYVGSGEDNRYTMGTSFQLNGFPAATPGHTVGRNFMNYVAHAAARQAGSGLGHIYHIFLPQGVDACFSATFCYSPDNPSTWVLCAAHTATLFVDAVGLTVFTVEPYQNVAGCNVAPGATPNGQLADSTYYALLHEVFEAITDPWTYSAWYVHALTFGYGNEIADVCESFEVVNGNIYSGVSNIKLNGHSYSVPAVYSNRIHGCAYGPGGGN